MNEDKLFVLSDTPTTISASAFPKNVGRCEILPNYYFQLSKMPNRFHRFMLRILLGWKFEIYDVDKPSEKTLLNG
jgi:hypothetical protein